MQMAMSELRKKKLAMLAKSIAKGDLASAAELLGSRGQAGVSRHRETPAAPMTLLEACGGQEAAIRLPRGEARFHLIRRSLADLGEDCLAIAAEYASVMRGARQRFDELRASAELCHAANARPEDALFLDIESCGLIGTGIFLVGTMSYAGEQLVFEQYLARNYAEEEGIVQAFADRLAEAGLLVSFNGKAFDMNLIRERAAFHHVPLPRRQPPHLDLLVEARRLWKGRLPNCRLQTLERHLCRRSRLGDIPGCAIPDAYHRFVSTGDARVLRDILHHNMLDLLTMVQLLCMALSGSDVLTD
jgi:uncharacterized protein YprB with RNaseH-like and TPR domain